MPTLCDHLARYDNTNSKLDATRCVDGDRRVDTDFAVLDEGLQILQDRSPSPEVVQRYGCRGRVLLMDVLNKRA